MVFAVHRKLRKMTFRRHGEAILCIYVTDRWPCYFTDDRLYLIWGPLCLFLILIMSESIEGDEHYVVNSNKYVWFILVWKMKLYSVFKYVLWKGKSSIHQSLACRHDFFDDVFLHAWCKRSRQKTETQAWMASKLCTIWSKCNRDCIVKVIIYEPIS